MKKYRPYFTLPELEAILESTKMNSRVVIQGKDLIIYLERFIRDIKDGLRSEDLNLIPKQTVSQKLGFEEPSKASTSTDVTEFYNIYVQSGYTNLTPAQIEILNQYLFENDLMTPEQEADYIKVLMSANSWLGNKRG